MCLLLIILSFYLVSELTHSQKLIWAAVPVTEIITFAAAVSFFTRFRKDLGKIEAERL